MAAFVFWMIGLAILCGMAWFNFWVLVSAFARHTLWGLLALGGSIVFWGVLAAVFV